jgi:hypothetical protein
MAVILILVVTVPLSIVMITICVPTMSVILNTGAKTTRLTVTQEIFVKLTLAMQLLVVLVPNVSVMIMINVLMMNVIMRHNSVIIPRLIVMTGVSVLMMSAIQKLASVHTLKYTAMIMMLVQKTYVYPKLVVPSLK